MNNTTKLFMFICLVTAILFFISVFFYFDVNRQLTQCSTEIEQAVISQAEYETQIQNLKDEILALQSEAPEKAKLYEVYTECLEQIKN